MSYAAAFLGTIPVVFKSGANLTPDPNWTRPADWITLPTLGATEQKMVAIMGVENSDANFVSLSVTVSGGGTYSVDWGDGTISSGIASGTKTDYKYDWSNVSLGAAKADGFKQALVTVTVSGGDMTGINLQQRHATLPAINEYVTNWLDISINGPSITSLTVGGSTMSLNYLRKFTLGVVAVTSFASLFQNCRRLVQLSQLGSSAIITNMSTMFSSCTSIQTIPPFPGSVAAVTSMSSMFSSCTSIQTIPPFPGSVAAVTSMSNMFLNCNSLQTIPPFPGSVAAVTNMSSMFLNCNSLQTIPPFPGSVAAVTNMSGMFQSCNSLQTIPPFPGSVAAVTNMSNMFSGCVSLQTIPSFETSGVSSVANASNMFTSCRNLSKGRTNGLQYAVNYNGCKLSSSEINEIFTGLGTAAGATTADKTITISQNYGFAGCDQTIATAKGWTVA